jgi:hypothetical protein
MGQDGRPVGIAANVPILTPIEPGQRLSFMDHVRYQGNFPGLMRFEAGSAKGEMTMVNGTVLTAQIAITAGNARDLDKVRQFFMEQLGMVDRSPRFLAMPQLASRLERLKWFLRWLWHGATEVPGQENHAATATEVAE